MQGAAEGVIRELVDRETRAWDTRDLDLLLSIFHPDMVWPWPPHKDAHDPVEWVIPWGRFDEARWRVRRRRRRHPLARRQRPRAPLVRPVVQDLHAHG